MALYLLNISVDAQDPESNTIPEDLLINDQESIVELILEEVLGFQNAIPEYDDPDAEEPESQKQAKSFKLESLSFAKAADLNHVFQLIEKINFPDPEQLLTEGHHQQDTPPPRY